MQADRMGAKMTAPKGFTLVEILIVVIILGILAVMIIPQFSSATQSARASMLMDDLRVMRTQLEVFKAQHNGVPPGFPNGDSTKTPTEAVMLDHVTKSSNQAGATAAINTPGYPYGPYMREIPANPLNGKSSVRVIQASEALPNSPADQYGWIYQPSTMTFKSDCLGTDNNGTPYFDY
jgi:prepilin-type N-terminal cleavage/methylation domain-containing protein